MLTALAIAVLLSSGQTIVSGEVHDDHRHLAAQRTFAAGSDLVRDQKAASTRAAIERFTEALAEWRKLGERRREAETLHTLALAHAQLTKNREAITFAEQAAAIRRELGDRPGEAASLGAAGFAYEAISDLPKARERFDSALALYRAEGDRVGEARQLVGIGAVLHRMARNKEALECLELAHRVDRETGNQAAEVLTLRWIGNAWLGAGDRKKALEISQRALELARATGDRFEQGLLLNNIAVIAGYESNWERAIELFEESAAIHAEGGRQAEEANALLNIGVAWAQLGDHRRAISLFARALPISRALGDRGRELPLLIYLGGSHRDVGETEAAMKYLKAGLELARQLGLRRFEAIALNHYALLVYNARRFEEALVHHEQLLRINRETGNVRGEVNSLVNLGATLGSMGQCGPARARVVEALAQARQMEDRLLEGAALSGLARIDREEGLIADALHHAKAALEIAESLRATQSAQQIRTAFLSSVRDQYELEVDLFMQMHQRAPAAGFDALALQASERARARGLLEMLEEARAGIREGADPALLEQERHVRKLLNEKAAAQTRLLGSKPKPAQTAPLAREIEELTGQLQQLETQIRDSNPRYRALVEPAPPTIEEIQQLLDDDTVFVEYALGEPRSYAWVVTRESLRSFVLPRRAAIDTLARRVHALLSARPGAKSKADAALAELGEIVLGPIAQELRARRVVIAAEGALQYVPFAALLIADHEIVTIPSAATLALLRRGGARTAPEKTLIVLADSVFSADDPRLERVIPSAVEGSPSFSPIRGSLDFARDDTFARMQRLPFTRLEADSIARLVPASSRKKALDFEASRETAVGDEIRRYRIVHFATHAVLNSEHPELSGVVLSLFDEKGRPRDGFVRLHDVYRLRLPAELVVLSACQTALGKEIKGEGLIGLTRGFMHAGAPRVVASLWKVDDRATAELMRRFYEGMLGPRKLPPAAALRAAQLEMSRTAMWKQPYYWAGFLLQGEWR
jgi:CHAT domain-containing protein/tetratricopeptide (TPR) repeat protein